MAAPRDERAAAERDASATTGTSRRDALRVSAGIGLGITSSVLPRATAAATGGVTGAPEGSTLVTWSSGEQFDTWSSPTTTESDQLATDGNVWQLFQAHQDIEITDGTVDGLGIATTATAPNSFDDFFWYAAVSTADDTIGSITDITTLANVFGPDYTAGGLFTSDPIATVTIPAGRYFVIGQNEGPTYRAVRTLAASRTAVSGGVAQFTAINRVYYSQQQPGSATTLPTQIGGTGGFFTQLDGHALVMSIRFTVPG